MEFRYEDKIQLCGNQIIKYARNEFYFPRYKCEAHILFSVVTAAAALKVMVENMNVYGFCGRKNIIVMAK